MKYFLKLFIILKYVIRPQHTIEYWDNFKRNSKHEYNGQQQPLFEIQRSYARTGNHWKSIKRSFKFAICCRGFLSIFADFPSFPRLHRHYSFLDHVPNNTNHNLNCTSHSGNFYSKESDPFPIPTCYYDDHLVLQLFVFDNGLTRGIERNDQNCGKHNFDDTLVIQIRSGDIIEYPNEDYIQPPAVYYENLINSTPYRNILFLTSPEPIISPIWEYLSQYALENNHKKFHFQTTINWEEDFRVYMCARHFVGGMSTLSILSAEGSNVMETYYHFKSILDVPDDCIARRFIKCFVGMCNQTRENWVGHLLDSNNSCTVEDVANLSLDQMKIPHG